MDLRTASCSICSGFPFQDRVETTKIFPQFSCESGSCYVVEASLEFMSGLSACPEG
ncbi:hypothetical protein ACRRTK_016721 [Alexandromys fortis]